MSRDDKSSFSYDAEVDRHDGSSGKGLVWNYGSEIWCSQTGRYVHLIADMTHLVRKGYNVSICSLGLMGTKFDRDEPV